MFNFLCTFLCVHFPYVARMNCLVIKEASCPLRLLLLSQILTEFFNNKSFSNRNLLNLYNMKKVNLLILNTRIALFSFSCS